MKKSRQEVWNILANAIFTILGNIRRNLCTSYVVPESLVAPVARATTLSPSASVAQYTPRFILNAPLASLASLARSLAARQQSNFQTSLYVFLRLWEHLRGVCGRLRPFGIVLDSSWAVLEQTWRVLWCLRHFCTHVSHILSHLKAILARAPPPRPPSNGFS